MRKTAKRDEEHPDLAPASPSDLSATVALSAEALAALLEEVKGTRNAPLRADGTTGPDHGQNEIGEIGEFDDLGRFDRDSE